jgi:uncharacterized protein (DUF2252 family)
MTLTTPTSGPTGHRTRAESQELGRRARDRVPPATQGEVVVAPDRTDPVTLAFRVEADRVPELVPIRHERMAASPFAFLRGNAMGMAADLATAPVSGLRVQVCGDAHLSNFGLFGSAERRLLFDLNDFDETFPGPWEWDVKRLAASVEVAGRENGFSSKERRRAVRGTVRRFRDAMAEFAAMNPLDVWYAMVDADELRALRGGEVSGSERRRVDQALKKARSSGRMKALAKLTEVVDGGLRIKSDPPLVTRISELLPTADRDDLLKVLDALLHDYTRSLPNAVRSLLDRYELVDMARKVVGVGSVGTRCWVVLMRGVDEEDPLFLQVKEAGRSVVADHVPAGLLPPVLPVHEGEGVVDGQRLMQAAGDIFLGWTTALGIDGRERDFYVRQLKDMKFSAAVETMHPDLMRAYGTLCGWTLARAHARTGDPIAIAAYLGDDDVFPDAIAAFAEQYAELNATDHAAFADAVGSGRLPSSSGATQA